MRKSDQPRIHARGREEGWNQVKFLGFLHLPCSSGVGLENEKRRMVKGKGSPLFPLTILYTNPVIYTHLQITERLELVTLLLGRLDWIYENDVNENFTLVKRFDGGGDDIKIGRKISL